MLSAEKVLTAYFGPRSFIIGFLNRCLCQAFFKRIPEEYRQWEGIRKNISGVHADKPVLKQKKELIQRCFGPVSAFDSSTGFNVMENGCSSQTMTLLSAYDKNLPENLEKELERQYEKVIFIIQSALVLLIKLLLQERFGLSEKEVNRLLGITLFDWWKSSESLDDEVLSALRKILRQFEDQYRPVSKNKKEYDIFGLIYQRLFPRAIRQLLGEFYTPGWLVDYLWRQEKKRYFDSCKTPSCPFPRVLDPACGSGVFLLTVLQDGIRHGLDAGTVLEHVAGIELNPLAVLMARANMVCWLFQYLSRDEILQLTLPVYWGDSILHEVVSCSPVTQKRWRDTNSGDKDISCENRIQEWDKNKTTSCPLEKNFDLIIGNPPWISWDLLSKDYREKTKPLWRRYGLFSLSGTESLHGGGKKELAALMFYSVADYYLKENGFLAMVLPLSLLKSQKSDEGFRHFGISGRPFRVLEIDDFSQCSLFPGVQSAAMTVLVENDSRTCYPVPCLQWLPSSEVIVENLPERRLEIITFDHCKKPELLIPELYDAVPVDPLKSGSPLKFVSKSSAKTVEMAEPSGLRASHIKRGSRLFYENQAQLGANTGGANGVYWLEAPNWYREYGTKYITVKNLAAAGKKKVPVLRTTLETALVYPLLRWRDVTAFSAFPSAWILMAQDVVTRRGIEESVLKECYPKTFDYLMKFELLLRERAAYKKFQAGTACWSMYNVNQATLALIKVVWRRIDTRIRAAVVLPDPISGKPVIPQETLSMVAVGSVEEADYLAARLNSEENQQKVRQFSIPGSKSFGSPGILSLMEIPCYDPNSAEHHKWSERGKTFRHLPE